MILFRSPRRHGRVRVQVRKPGLTDREIASMLAPHSGDVEFAPVDPPKLDDVPDGDEPEGAAA